jgi:hypothetical protein
MAIQNFYTSRDNKLDGNTYVGQFGRLWYNPDTNSIYASDGVTVGGIPVALATGANATFDTITVNTVTSTSGDVNITGNLIISGNISPAAVGKIGGIQPGPGVSIGNTGILTIDSANLPVSFGNFFANNNILSIVNEDENMILATQGNAEIQLVGNIGFYKSNGLPPAPEKLYFFARDDGQLTIIVPAEDPLLGAVEIIGSATGNLVPPGASGAMLQLTGNPNIPCRLYVDGNDAYASIIGRRWGGNVAVPTQVLAGQDVLRINATAATDAGVGNVALAQISMTALENQTTTAQGSEITFTVTPVGQPAANRVDVANVTVANGVTATKFTTAGNVTAAGNISGGNLLTTGVVSATGNITGGNVTATTFTGNVVGNVTGTATTATNLAAATSILAGQLNIDPAAIGKNTSSTQTFTLNGLTTSHKVLVMPQAALPYQLVISAAWASAANTLSIQFQEFGGGVDPAAFNLAYFAWV